jgi:glycine cleavage system regulatory protein
MAKDQPGVLAEIARIFGNHEISIASMLPRSNEDGAETLVPIVITTHISAQQNNRGRPPSD